MDTLAIDTTIAWFRASFFHIVMYFSFNSFGIIYQHQHAGEQQRGGIRAFVEKCFVWRGANFGAID